MIVCLIILLLVQTFFLGGSLFYYLEGKINGITCTFLALSQLCAIVCAIMMLFGLHHPNYNPIQE